MNRQYLLDSLDGFKALIFRLLPIGVVDSVACVPMTTDGPWTDAEKAVFETAIGIPSVRTFWAPGGFQNVPRSQDPVARTRWVNAVATIGYPYLFLDPDTGFYTHHGSESEKKVLLEELDVMLRSRKALIVYRHQYWPDLQLDDAPPHAYLYVLHGLGMLRAAGFVAFAYQSQAASFFFVAEQEAGIEPFQAGFRRALSGVSADVINRRIVV
jgi:hypothetical protein